jgi:hypothetical protein
VRISDEYLLVSARFAQAILDGEGDRLARFHLMQLVAAAPPAGPAPVLGWVDRGVTEARQTIEAALDEHADLIPEELRERLVVMALGEHP